MGIIKDSWALYRIHAISRASFKIHGHHTRFMGIRQDSWTMGIIQDSWASYKIHGHQTRSWASHKIHGIIQDSWASYKIHWHHTWFMGIRQDSWASYKIHGHHTRFMDIIQDSLIQAWNEILKLFPNIILQDAQMIRVHFLCAKIEFFIWVSGTPI